MGGKLYYYTLIKEIKLISVYIVTVLLDFVVLQKVRELNCVDIILC